MTGHVVEVDIAHQALETEKREEVDHVTNTGMEDARGLGVVHSSLGRIDETLRFLAGDHVGGLGVEIDDGRRKPDFLGIALGAHQLPDRDDSAVNDAEGRDIGRVEDLDDPETLKDLRVMLGIGPGRGQRFERSEEHTSELQSLMRISYAVFCLKKKKKKQKTSTYPD